MKLSTPSNLNVLIDNECCADANLQHMMHVFEGYRDRTLGITYCEYSPDSARALSWTMGRGIAEQDFRDKTTEGN